eukprot:3133510-Prymnesium_polylepis.1
MMLQSSIPSWLPSQQNLGFGDVHMFTAVICASLPMHLSKTSALNASSNRFLSLMSMWCNRV